MVSPLVSFIIAVCRRRSHPEPPDIAKGHTYSLCLNWDTEVPLGIETNIPSPHFPPPPPPPLHPL